MEPSVKIENDLDILSTTNTPETRSPPSFYEEIVSGQTKLYCCTYPDCSKAFRYKSEVIRHNAIHSDHRPFVCTFEGCNKAFKRPDTLEAHLRVHSEELPFNCKFPGCNYKSRNKSSLYYHSMKHENKTNFKCRVEGCEKTFETKAGLKQHEKGCTYHDNVITKKEEYEELEKFEEPVKLVKTSPVNPENKGGIQEIVSHINERSEKINESLQSFQSTFDEEEMQKNFNFLLSELQIENKILNMALRLQFGQLNNIQKLNSSILGHKCLGQCKCTAIKNEKM